MPHTDEIVRTAAAALLVVALPVLAGCGSTAAARTDAMATAPAVVHVPGAAQAAPALSKGKPVHTDAVQHPAAAPTLSRLARALQSATQRLETWLGERRKSAGDEAALSGMSARELRDIGLDPAYASNHGHGDGVRDWA